MSIIEVLACEQAPKWGIGQREKFELAVGVTKSLARSVLQLFSLPYTPLGYRVACRVGFGHKPSFLFTSFLSEIP